MARPDNEGLPKKVLTEMEVQLAIFDLQRRMGAMELIVTQFSTFRTDMTQFITRHETREEEREKQDKRRSTIHFSLLGGLITLVVGLAITLFTWVLNGHHTVTEADPPAHISQSQSGPQDAAAIPLNP